MSMLLLSLAQAAAKPEPALKSAVEPKLINLLEMISTDDYPVEAVRAKAQGTAHVRVRVNVRGEPEACKVVTSSGHADLDGQTCDVIMGRGRFSPGKDRRRRAVIADADVRVRWVLPEERGPAPVWKAQKATLTVAPDGELRNCVLSAKLEADWTVAPPGACEQDREYQLESLLRWREGSKLHDAVIVDEQLLILDANEPWPTPGQGPGEKLIAIRALQMTFGPDGSLKSCSVVRSSGLEEENTDMCSQSEAYLGEIAADRKAETSMRFVTAVYLANEPE